jgi:hypothetical protein
MQKLVSSSVVKFLVCILCVALLGVGIAHAAGPATKEPIAYTGHGAMFNHEGKEVAPSLTFVGNAQLWYRDHLVAKLTEAQRAEFVDMEDRLTKGLALDQQSRLTINGMLIDWLIGAAGIKDGKRMQRMNNLLKWHLKSRLPVNAEPHHARSSEPFTLKPELEARLRSDKQLAVKRPSASKMTTASRGQPYIDLCRANGVPIPPDVGGSSWVSHGEIPQSRLFIVAGYGAEVLTWQSPPPATPASQPEGMCIALPRFQGNTVKLDGVICTGKVSGKVCFWDNEKNGVINEFPRGTSRPLLDFGGGTELLGDIDLGGGGVCSDCHAGANPFIVHPDPANTAPTASVTKLGALRALGLPTFPDVWPDPIVRTGDTTAMGAPLIWPENPGPMNGPPACTGCHREGGDGRFPHLSTALSGYCGSVLRPAINRTMPPGAPGSLASDPDVLRMLAWCDQPPSGNASGRGDPHITTVNGVAYDFQGAGEFVYLRAADMEIQTRQTPVATATAIGPNAHTGLTSCVSVNTAVAARVGKHRVTFQPNPNGEPDLRGLQVRIDGKAVPLGKGPIDLGGGRITGVAESGGFEIDFPDKTQLVVTPGWFGAPNNMWYLHVDVFNTPGREGILGTILPGDWLPVLPDGSSLGPKPASLSQRHIVLNRKFADAWRVNDWTSLFDYAPGASTKSFTNRQWPPEKPPCVIPGSSIPPVKPMPPEKAASLCSEIKDKEMNAQCIFDVTVTGEASFAKTYQIHELVTQ